MLYASCISYAALELNTVTAYYRGLDEPMMHNGHTHVVTVRTPTEKAQTGFILQIKVEQLSDSTAAKVTFKL